jgi:hypothetical protein
MLRFASSWFKPGLALALLGLIPACNNSLGNGGAAGSGPVNPVNPGPDFSGLTSATPGAAAGQVLLSWSPAVDHAGAGITYLVFQSNAGSGMEDMSGPTLTSGSPTGMVVTGVSGVQYWYIVRARDGNGATDGNVVERMVVVP